MNWENKRILISRTDSIGDVMLTLPICGWLKEQFPHATLIFLGKGYTKAILEQYNAIDEIVDWNDFNELSESEKVNKFAAINADAIVHVFPQKEIARVAKKAKIHTRIGTSHRLFHVLTCNIRPNFTRKKSALHESQLNFELMRPFGLSEIPPLEKVMAYTDLLTVPADKLPQNLSKLYDYTILHPKSQGSAKEWPLENYMTLATKLAAEGRTVIFTGTQQEGDFFREMIPPSAKIIDTTGRLTLNQLMVLISNAKNLVACSTGPLHIAGFYGVNTIGIFSPRRPIHPGRWKALGAKVKIAVNDAHCPTCKEGKDCNCLEEISVEKIYQLLE